VPIAIAAALMVAARAFITAPITARLLIDPMAGPAGSDSIDDLPHDHRG